jgi:RhtB (resistance to homoserine/threonine) family protein
MNITDLILLLSIATLALLSPGPDMLLIIKNSALHHRKEAFLTVYGICCGLLIHFSYCVWGLGYLIQENIYVFYTIKIAGALYLLFIGYKMIRNANKTVLLNSSEPNSKTSSPFMEGFLCNLLNPKASLFFIAFFSQFASTFSTIPQKLALSGILMTHSLILWCLVVLFLQINKIKALFQKAQKSISYFFGGLLMLVGIKVLVSK